MWSDGRRGLLRSRPLPGLTVDADDDCCGPTAPKRRCRVDRRADRLAAFATAAERERAPATARPIARTSEAVVAIQATWRGHCTRVMISRTRPCSAPSSEEGAPPGASLPTRDASTQDEIPEEIDDAGDDDDDDDRSGAKVCTVTALALYMAATLTSAEDGFDSALEHSGELESSGEVPTELHAVTATPSYHRRRTASATTRTCAICLGEMEHRRQPTSFAGPAPLTVATLDCSHRFHRKCLLNWCRQRGRLAECPLCRTEVVVRRRPRPSALDPASQHHSTER